MSQNVVESIFNSKKNLNDFYPQFSDTKVFDLHKKHLFYGRIDPAGDAIYLNTETSDGYLTQLIGGKSSTHLALDFVSKAFEDMGKNVKKAANAGYVSKNSLYPTKLVAHKSWTNGDLDYSYGQYMSKVYRTFVDTYLSIDRRHEKIKNYHDFVREFLNFSLKTADYFPITRTGYLMSIHCSPFVSGLMIEVAKQSHGLQNNKTILNYVSDVNFNFFVKEAKKFGFMVDKNAPWRIVFNLASGIKDVETSGKLTGGQLYMDKYAATFENVFQSYYRKAYLDELVHIRDEMYNMYDNFYQQFGTYEEMSYVVCEKGRPTLKSSFSIKEAIVGRIKTVRKNRQPPPNYTMTGELFEYWIKVVLKLRMAETKTPHTPQNFNFYSKKAIDNYRLFGVEAALKYINELTKGLHVTKFLTKGSYWYGLTKQEYEQKKIEAQAIAMEPSTADYSLTATKNFK